MFLSKVSKPSLKHQITDPTPGQPPSCQLGLLVLVCKTKPDQGFANSPDTSSSFHRKVVVISFAAHLERDYVPANLPFQARWFSYVAARGNQMENAQMLLST